MAGLSLSKTMLIYIIIVYIITYLLHPKLHTYILSRGIHNYLRGGIGFLIARLHVFSLSAILSVWLRDLSHGGIEQTMTATVLAAGHACTVRV